MPVTNALRRPRLRSGPGLATVLTVAAAIGALLATAIIALLPVAAYASFPVADPYGLDPITEVDGVPLDELAPHTVVEIDTGALPNHARSDVRGWLERQPGVDRVDRAGPRHFLLVGPDVAAATAIDGVVDAFEEEFAQLSSLPSHVPLQWHLKNTGQAIPSWQNGDHESGVVIEENGTENVDISWMFAKERATGAGVTVAVIDSAFDFAHPDLAGSRWVNPGESCSNGVDDTNSGKIDDCQGWNFLRDSNDVATVAEGSEGIDIHGTHVAATIAASLTSGNTAGVAPDATIMPLQVTEGSAFPLTRVAEAVTYAVDEGADVINLSLASDPGTATYTPLADAFQHALDQGVFVVAAAGNAGIDIDADGQGVLPASYAKDFINVVAVAATDFDDELSLFSNFGTTTVELAAPGQMILSAAPGDRYWYMSGTSMAAPVVAATAALVIEHQDPLVTELKGILIDAAVDAAVTGVVGGVRLNAAAALGIPVIGDGDFEVEATGLDDLDPALAISSGITVRAPVGVTPRFTLGIWLDDGAYAVVRHPATLEAGSSSVTGATSDEGVLAGPGMTGDGTTDPTLSEADRAALTGAGLTYNLSTRLPEGRYVLLIDDVQQAPIEPTALFFTVGDLPAIPPPDDPGGDSTTGDGTTGDGTTGDGTTGDGTTGDGTTGDGTTGDGTTGDGTTGDGTTGDGTTGDGTTGDGTAGDGTTGDGTTGDGTAGDGTTGGGTGDDTTSDQGGDPTGGSSLTPSSGPTAGGTLVQIQGSFATGDADTPTQVSFGGTRVGLSSLTEIVITLLTPPRAEPGKVDVVVLAGEDVLERYVDGFTYIDEFGNDGSTPDGGDGTTGDGTTGDGTTGDGTTGDGTTGDGTTGGGDEGTDTSPPSDADDADPPNGGGVDGGELPGGTDQGEPAGPVWPPTVLSNGLTAARYTSLHALGGIALSHWSSSCTVAPCSSRSL